MRTRIVLASALIAGCSVIPLARGQTPRASQEEEQAVRKAAESLAAAFNKGDSEAIIAVWAPDADYVDENGKSFKGRAAIGAAFKEALANLKGHRMKSHTLSIRFIKPDVAIEDGRMELIAPDGTTEGSRYSAVWVKSGEKWLISSARDLPNQPAQTPDQGVPPVR